MRYEVEYLEAAQQKLEKLIAYLNETLAGSVAKNVFQAELSYVQKAVDQIDSLLARIPRHLGHPFEKNSPLARNKERPDQMRFVTVGPISVIYGLYSKVHRVLVLLIVFHPDRN